MRKLVTLEQFARSAGLSRSTVYRLRRDGQLDCVMIGRAVRIDAAYARAWIDRHRASQNRTAKN